MLNRNHMLSQLQDHPAFDIVVTGGGATGLGIAVDAASRGYKTLLVEQRDFASGSSSRSTKLVHGGVRYLAQGNIKLVKESLRERGILLRNAPHVCHNIRFCLPVFSWFDYFFYGIGLTVYEWIAGKWSLGKTKWLSASSTKKLLPGLAVQKIKGAVVYHDGQFNDSRLAINLAQTAAEQGAWIINYCKLDGIRKENGKIIEVTVTDTLSNNAYVINCKVLINATGVFTDAVMQTDDPMHKSILTVSRGSHIVVDQRFMPGNHAMIIPKTDDGRVLFAVPWEGKLVIGTTDIPVKTIEADPEPTEIEIDFMIAHANRYLSTAIRREDVLAVFAGLRPLVKSVSSKSTALLPRDHHIVVSPSGMVTVTGGKWTTYREMAKQAVDNAALVVTLPKKECVTASLKIHGYRQNVNENEKYSQYGTDALMILDIERNDPSQKNLLHPDLPYTLAEITHIINHEMVCTIEDVLSRRTRALVINARAALDSAPKVASMMAVDLKKDDLWVKSQLTDFEKLAHRYMIT